MVQSDCQFQSQDCLPGVALSLCLAALPFVLQGTGLPIVNQFWGLMLLQYGSHVGGLDCSGVRVLLTVENCLQPSCACAVQAQLVTPDDDEGTDGDV